MKKSIFSLFLLVFFSFISSNLFAQEALKSSEEEYYDYLSLKGFVEKPTLGYRTLSDSEWNIHLVGEEEPIWENNNLGSTYTLFEPFNVNSNWFLNGINQNITMKIYGPEWINSYNSDKPYGQNDGALWQGRGYNTSLSTGVRFEGYGFELTFKPQVSFSQNLPFEIGKSDVSNEYGYIRGGIDLVQRFGDKSFWTFDWGDSEVRWSLYNFTMGFGTQSPWLGPAWLNPMLGSNNAATYPKFDIGLRKTQLYIPFTDIYLGDIEGRVFLGRLEESKYFDNKQSNDYSMLSGLTLAYSPSFIPGLTVGANRIFISEWKIENLKYLGRLFTLSTGNSTEDQKASLFMDWLFPQVGFEFYGELGIDDFTLDKVANPFHTAIYTVGFKKTVPIASPNFDSEIIFEWNNFEMSQDFQLQWQYGGYYFHGGMPHGYTNKGQIPGAGSGAMGNSQFLGYKLYYPKGQSMAYFHRFCPDNNFINNKAVDNTAGNIKEQWYAAYETYMVWGISTEYFVFDSLLLNANVAFVWDHNPNYNKFGKDIYGFNVKLGAKYNF